MENLVVIMFLLLFSVHYFEHNEIFMHKMMKIADKEMQKTNDFLQHLMPTHVLSQLQQQKTVAEQVKDVPIMFADIVGFTNFSSERTPQEVVEALSELFSKFDNLCNENLCYKVCTIGDCYVALGYHGDD